MTNSNAPFNWYKLKRPILALAPMEDVTDTVFRQIICEYGRPDVMFTEFTSCEGLLSRGVKLVSQRLRFEPSEQPLIAQIWGKDPEHFRLAAQIIKSRGFAGIDLNFGCPQKNVMKHGCGAALIQDQVLVKKIIAAAKEGADGLPLSIKTRIGVKSIETEKWIKFLLEQGLDALTIHGRTASEMSKVDNHWDEIAKAVVIRDLLKVDTLILGNGDVGSRQEGLQKVKEFNLDGVMVGRGIFKNIRLFHPLLASKRMTKAEKIEALKEHVALFSSTWGKEKNFAGLKKYFKIYLSGFPGANNLRTRLFETKRLSELIYCLENI